MFRNDKATCTIAQKLCTVLAIGPWWNIMSIEILRYGFKNPQNVKVDKNLSCDVKPLRISHSCRYVTEGEMFVKTR